MKRVLVLGVTGMLGSMVNRYLRRNPSLHVAGSGREAAARSTGTPCEFTLDAGGPFEKQIARIITEFPADYVINCIGVINVYCRDNNPEGVLRSVQVNALFPHLLYAELRRVRPCVKVLHITTDCVFSGRAGKYDELAVHDPVDFYGKSKSLGEVKADSWLNLRCSIIGPEVANRKSLLEWFLAQPGGGIVQGFANHLWNGVTTLQYAQFCEEILLHDSFESLRRANNTVHYVPNETVSKYQLLQLFNETYCLRHQVQKTCAPGPPVDRTLASVFLKLPLIPMRSAVQALKRFCDEPLDDRMGRRITNTITNLPNSF